MLKRILKYLQCYSAVLDNSSMVVVVQITQILVGWLLTCTYYTDLDYKLNEGNIMLINVCISRN